MVLLCVVYVCVLVGAQVRVCVAMVSKKMGATATLQLFRWEGTMNRFVWMRVRHCTSCVCVRERWV